MTNPTNTEAELEDYTHYHRTCCGCGNNWWGLHCPHDRYQNPCPECDAIPQIAPSNSGCNCEFVINVDEAIAHTAKAVEEAELKARFELMIRVLLTLGKNIVISKKSLQEPLERYEIQTYKSPVSSQPGIVYRLLESQENTSE